MKTVAPWRSSKAELIRGRGFLLVPNPLWLWTFFEGILDKVDTGLFELNASAQAFPLPLKSPMT